MCQFAGAIADDIENLPLIAKAMDGSRFREMMNVVQYGTQTWNRFFIEMFHKDFWKEFVNRDGDWIDEDGNLIDRDGSLIETS